MSSSSSAPSTYQALYQATVWEAAAGGESIMGKLVGAVRKSLHARVAGARDMRERDVHEESLKHLLVQEPLLRTQYPQVLLEAFNKPVPSAKAPSLSLSEVHFDQLELMDEAMLFAVEGRLLDIASEVTAASSTARSCPVASTFSVL